MQNLLGIASRAAEMLPGCIDNSPRTVVLALAAILFLVRLRTAALAIVITVVSAELCRNLVIFNVVSAETVAGVPELVGFAGAIIVLVHLGYVYLRYTLS